jgi:uncharacterized protein (TIGR02147 family)
MAKNLYSTDSYVQVIKSKISEKKEKWGLISEMAEACECQKSHFSRVLSGKVDLTLEQAVGLCEYFAFNEVETDYFLNLVQYARAGTKKLKQRIEKRIKHIRQEQEDLSKRLNKPSIGVEQKEIVYYSAWYWSAIHILVSIPEYQTIRAVAQKLSLTESFVTYCLETLEQYDLVGRHGSLWKTTSTPIHLSKKSSLIGLHHNNWRARAVLSAQNPQDDGIHYTVVQSVSQSDFGKIKQLLLDTVEEYMKTAGPSKEEELVCFCLDWFRA